MSELYKVTVGEDNYLGTAEEVVAFMARADGAPGEDLVSYMQGIAERVDERLSVSDIPSDDPEAFLLALQKRGVLKVEVHGEPSDERSDPKHVVGDGPVAYGPGVDPHDIDVG